MANSIKNDPGSKRYAGHEERAVRQKLDSTKPTYLERLPYEIKKMVAEHFQRDDLERLAKISPDWKAAALDAFNTQCMQEEVKKLKVCAVWNQQKPKVASTVDFYRFYVGSLQDPTNLQDYPGLQITPEKLVDLQKRQAELFTRQAETELLELQAACLKDVDQGVSTFKSIEEKYRSKQTAFVTQGLNHTIASTMNPIIAKEYASHCAAEYGQLDILQFLLPDTALINEQQRGSLVIISAQQDRLEIVKFLLSGGAQISEDDRGVAFGWALGTGRLEMLKALLANDAQIPTFRRGIALEFASSRGHLEIVQFLLSNGDITNEYRDRAVVKAAFNGHLAVVQALLENGAISNQSKNLSFGLAVHVGHSDIVRLFLEIGGVSEEDKSWAVREAVIKGHIEVVQILVARGAISDKDRKVAHVLALTNQRNDIADVLRRDQG